MLKGARIRDLVSQLGRTRALGRKDCDLEKVSCDRGWISMFSWLSEWYIPPDNLSKSDLFGGNFLRISFKSATSTSVRLSTASDLLNNSYISVLPADNASARIYSSPN